jgi:hypothetical protein
LSSLLDLAPADSVRLVVFSLDQQKEIYRRDRFTPDQLEAVRQAMFNLQLGIVDFQTLQHPEGRADLLAGLVNGELEAQNPSDAVVFLGPQALSDDKLSGDMGSRDAGVPRFFYLQCHRPAMLMAPLEQVPIRAGHLGVVRSSSDDPRPRPQATPIPGPDLALPSIGPGNMEHAPRDTIVRLVAALKGKTLAVRTPGEFAKAMKLVAGGK